MVNSLKLAQRAELWEKENNLIKALYVDPLPSNGIFKQLINDNTVFLIGKKGTGKSTIFSRVQEHFRESKSEISAYVDVKTVYGKSNLPESIEEKDFNVKLALYEGFINETLSDLFSELEKSLNLKNKLLQLWKKKDYEKLIRNLNEVKEKSQVANFREVSVTRTVQISRKSGDNKEIGASVNGEANVQTTAANVKIGSTLTSKTSNNSEFTEDFSTSLIREFNLKDLINEITSALEDYGINKFHIILDDFSEIDQEAQKVFVDTILAPLNNWF